MCGRHDDAYGVSAEFYDILHRAEYQRHAATLAAPAAAAGVGIVELGAGTGLVTEVLARASSVPVHAVEPATAMRSVLLSRLAAADRSVADRVTVHACPAQGIAYDLEGQADLAVCLRVIACLSPPERPAVWRALAACLVPDGLLFLDRPPAQLPDGPRRRLLGEARVGSDTYAGWLTECPDGGRIRYAYSYRVHRQGRVVRRAEETFHLWPMTSRALEEELADAGFRLEATASPEADVLRATRLASRTRSLPCGPARGAGQRKL